MISETIAALCEGTGWTADVGPDGTVLMAMKSVGTGEFVPTVHIALADTFGDGSEDLMSTQVRLAGTSGDDVILDTFDDRPTLHESFVIDIDGAKRRVTSSATPSTVADVLHITSELRKVSK